MGATLKKEGNYLNLLCFYNPPQKSLNNKVIEFAEKLGHFLIVGDLNYKLSESDGSDNRNGKKLKETIESHNYYVLNKKKLTYIFSRA